MSEAAPRVAIYARVSTRDKDQNPETQLRPLREHMAGHHLVGEFVDRAGADDLRGRREWRWLLQVAQRRRLATGDRPPAGAGGRAVAGGHTSR